MTLNWQERRWQRFFNHEEPGNIEPVYMLEKVENQQAEKWDVHNFTMGFQRQVTDDAWEYLLLNGKNHLTSAVSLNGCFHAPSAWISRSLH